MASGGSVSSGSEMSCDEDGVSEISKGSSGACISISGRAGVLNCALAGADWFRRLDGSS